MTATDRQGAVALYGADRAVVTTSGERPFRPERRGRSCVSNYFYYYKSNFF